VPNLSLCVGVTRLAPEQVDFEDFEEISDLAEPSWVLSGTEVFHSGVPLESDYPLDLDLVAMGSKVGVMVTSDGELHFFHDGRDMGCAAKDIPAGKNLCFCCHGKDILRYADSSNIAHSFTQITLQDKLWVVLRQYYSFHIDYCELHNVDIY